MGLGQGRDGLRVIGNEGGLDQVRLHQQPEKFIQQLAEIETIGEALSQLLSRRAYLLRRGEAGQHWAAMLLQQSPVGFPTEGGGQIDLQAPVGQLELPGGRGSAPDKFLCKVHHLAIVGVGLVELQHGELGVMVPVHALIAEILGQLVHLLETADNKPLQVELIGNAQVEGLIECVVMGSEGPCRGAAVEGLQGRCFHLHKAVTIQTLPQVADDLCTVHEMHSDLRVGDEVQVAPPVTVLLVFEGIENLAILLLQVRQWPQAFGQQGQLSDFHGNLTGAGPEHRPPDPQEITQVDAAEQFLIGGLADIVPLQVNLLAAVHVLEMDEAGLPHAPHRHHPASDAHIIREGPIIQILQIGAAVANLEMVRIGFVAQLAQLGQLPQPLLPDFHKGPLGLGH